MPKARIGTFDDLMEMTPESLRSVLQQLRAIINDIDPDTHEVVRLGDRASTFGLGPKKMTEGYVYIMPHTSWVNLGFYAGATLPDPEGLLEGTGARMRHAKIRTITDAQQPAVRSLIEAALDERRRALSR